MGHRALVAYKQTYSTEKESGVYNVHYTHWGANGLKLAHLINKSDPLGEEYVDEEPYKTELTLSEIVTDHLDYLHHEAFYVVDREYNVAPMRTLCLSFFDSYGHGHDGPETDTVGNGLLYAPRWYDGEPMDSRTQGKFRGMKDVVQDWHDDGGLSYDQAISYLKEKIQSIPGSAENIGEPSDTIQLERAVETAFENAPEKEKTAVNF